MQRLAALSFGLCLYGASQRRPRQRRLGASCGKLGGAGSVYASNAASEPRGTGTASPLLFPRSGPQVLRHQVESHQWIRLAQQRQFFLR